MGWIWPLRGRRRRGGRGRRGWRRWLTLGGIIALLAGGGAYTLLRPLAQDGAWDMADSWVDGWVDERLRPRRHGMAARRGAGSVVRGRVQVIDGDSLRVAGVEVRLHGIDAPEYRQTCRDARGRRYACGRRAAAHLRRLVGWRKVHCRRVTTDRYGRMVAVCTVNGQDIGRRMVRDGWAVAFVRYSRAYVGEERQARRARRGLWQGRFIMPSAWRRMKRRQ